MSNTIAQKRNRAIFRQMIGNRKADRLRDVILRHIILDYRRINGILPDFRRSLSVREWREYMESLAHSEDADRRARKYLDNVQAASTVRHFPLTYDV